MQAGGCTGGAHLELVLSTCSLVAQLLHIAGGALQLLLQILQRPRVLVLRMPGSTSSLPRALLLPVHSHARVPP